MSETGIRIEGLRKRYGEGDTAVDALKRYPDITRDLVGLFTARFALNVANRAMAQEEVLARIDAGLAEVSGIDDDRIIRLYQPEPRMPKVTAGRTRWASVP